MDRIAEIILNKLHCLSDIQTSHLRFTGGHHIQLFRERPEERIQKPFQHKLIRSCISIVSEHFTNSHLQTLPAAAPIDEPILPKPHSSQIVCGTFPVKSYPEVSPGISLIRLIKCQRAWLDQEPLAGFQLIFCPADTVASLSFQNIVDDVVWPDGRSIAVERPASGISAVAHVQIRKLPLSYL